MGLKLKPISEQVVVITGADSGIGLATARLAARRGAKVVLNSRNEQELARICAELRRDGAQAEWLAGDVADPNAMYALAEVAIRAFGRIDSWINNAGVSVYGRIEEIPLDDAHRLFETNYWGIVNGSLAALPYLKAKGGALINLGSIVSDTYMPLQGHYIASKHAVKGFTDALRTELMHEKAPVSVTLIKPGAIDTPYPEHAANYMDAEPRHPAPVYTPEVVARAIVHCAEHPRRSVTIGGGGRMMGLLGLAAPAVTDVMDQTMFKQQKRSTPGHLPQDTALWSPPARTGRTRGDQPGHIMKHSAYTAASLHPVRAGLALGVAALGYAIATGSANGLVRRGRELVEGLRGGGGEDAGSRAQVTELMGTSGTAAGAYSTADRGFTATTNAPDDVTIEVTREVYVMDDAALGDRFVP